MSYAYAVNLTQYELTKEQLLHGAFDLWPMNETARMRELLTFDVLSTKGAIMQRAEQLADIAARAHQDTDPADKSPPCALIDGPSYLMGPLEEALRKRGIRPVYAFFRRKVVKGQSILKFEGWIFA